MLVVSTHATGKSGCDFSYYPNANPAPLCQHTRDDKPNPTLSITGHLRATPISFENRFVRKKKGSRASLARLLSEVKRISISSVRYFLYEFPWFGNRSEFIHLFNLILVLLFNYLSTPPPLNTRTPAASFTPRT